MVDGILVEILALVVVAHDRLRVLVSAHHLNLPIGGGLVECAREGRLSQVVRGELAYSTPPQLPQRAMMFQTMRGESGLANSSRR